MFLENDSDYTHTPVLWKEIYKYIQNSDSGGRGYLVDCTLGEGGHSSLILNNFNRIKIVGFDWDAEILEIAKKRLRVYKERMDFINDNFSNILEHLLDYKEKMKYFLYDFGLSSYHIEKSMRGFSFSRDEALDMRFYNKRTDARNVINNYDENKLADIFYRFGEERWSRRIAGHICRERNLKEITSTMQLSEIILKSIPRKYHAKNIHPATRVFQAIRIYINDELDSIKKSLNNAFECLCSGGLIMAISFHSLEDRIVKDKFKRMARGCMCNADPAHCICGHEPYIKILTKKPVKPGEDEISSNFRSRSAKLRVCEKL